jgi:hypothetical protein
VESFIYRLASMGLRFCCPLLILAVSTPETMGSYYLFSVYFTFVVFLIALELAVPFSRKYLRRDRPAWRRKVFSSFVATQLGLSAVLAAPVALVYWLGADAGPVLVVLFALAILTETCVNEVGRFFWNIGQAKIASRRDLVRSLIFVTAVTAAVVFDDTVVSVVSLGIIVVCNTGILWRELRVWGDGEWMARGKFMVGRTQTMRLMKRVGRSVGESLPQVVHMQVLALHPLIERAVIESRIGMEMVGAYSFQYSVIQSGASLLLMPVVAMTRRSILAANGPGEWSRAYSLSLTLLLKIMLVAGALAVVAHFAIPILAAVLNKNISSTLPALTAALLAGVTATFSAAVSPLYARRGRLLRANVLALAAMLPMAALLLPGWHGHSSELTVMGAIMLAATLQMSLRVLYLIGGVRTNESLPLRQGGG